MTRSNKAKEIECGIEEVRQFVNTRHYLWSSWFQLWDCGGRRNVGK